MPHNTLTPPLASVLTELRSGTHTLHVALEKRLPFFSDSLDTGLYTRLLAAYYGFYQAMEEALVHRAWIPPGFDLHARLKTPALEQDLQAMNINPRALPRCLDLPAMNSQGSVLGVLYVLEGATLGGNVLRKRIAEHLGLDAHNGGAFLYVYGEATGRHWKSFLECLSDVPLDAQGCADAVNAACSTFSCFERWLERQEVLL